jgi:hypothetical protein
MSGYNLTIHTEHFSWAPERASTEHFAGEGHAHLYINDVKIGRLYGAHHHISSSALQAGENIITVTLNANTHEDYTVGGDLVAASATVMVEAEHGHDEHSHGEHGHDEHSHHSHDHQAANSIMLGDMELMLEPLLVADGSMKLALTVTEHAHHDHDHDKDISITLPDGSSLELHLHGDMALIELGTVQAGRYQLSGTLGHDDLDSGFTVIKTEGDLGTEVIAIITPDLHQDHASEVFIYAFADGEALHRAMMLEFAHNDHKVNLDLKHTHFSDTYFSADFEPMAEQVSVSLDHSGEWTATLTIMGGLPETASFQVNVAGN